MSLQQHHIPWKGPKYHSMYYVHIHCFKHSICDNVCLQYDDNNVITYKGRTKRSNSVKSICAKPACALQSSYFRDGGTTGNDDHIKWKFSALHRRDIVVCDGGHDW